MTDLTGKRVLITGGAIRVGAVLVRAFARAGATVLIHCRTNRAEAETLLAEVGGNGAVFSCDLTIPGEAERLIKDASPVDILVNNASGYVRAPFAEETADQIRAMLEINFLAPLALMKAFAKQAHGDANVINIADQAIHGYAPDGFGYLVSKKALADATRTAALAYAPSIRVNAVAPGPVIAPAGLEHLHMKNTLTRVPLKRAVSPEDVADAVLFLAANRSVTGTILDIDGGQHLFETHQPQKGTAE